MPEGEGCCKVRHRVAGCRVCSDHAVSNSDLVQLQDAAATTQEDMTVEEKLLADAEHLAASLQVGSSTAHKACPVAL